MSMFNKFAVMIAFAVCTTNAWAGICAPQKVEKLNNDKYFLYADGDTKYAFVCGGGGEYDCSNGTKLYIDNFVTDPYIVHRNKKEVAYIVECSDKLIDSKWVNKTDVGIGSLKKCSYDQWKEVDHGVRLNSGDVVFCKEMSTGFSCVSMNNEDVCYLDYPTLQEFVQQKAAEEEAKNSEEKTPETKKDCGNVGQRECDGDYKFYVCKTNADCGSEHLPSNATAGHCVSAGRSGYKVCTATDCGENYELARDKNGKSMGWCRKKTVQDGMVLTLKNGKKLNNLSVVDFRYADAAGKVYGYISYMDNTSSDVYFEMGDVSKINDQDVSSFLSGAKTGHIESTSWYIYECDTKNGYIAAEQIGVRDKLQHWTILSKPECDGATSGDTLCENIPVYKKCVKKSNNGESGTKSTTVFDNLDKFISEKFVGSSVWKNDEGNFNTARLVSDSVAGVVLGTAGGIITSHIIKKNQIENGFDDLKCTIGGQTVASYGDEFRVGVK